MQFLSKLVILVKVHCKHLVYTRYRSHIKVNGMPNMSSLYLTQYVLILGSLAFSITLNFDIAIPQITNELQIIRHSIYGISIFWLERLNSYIASCSPCKSVLRYLSIINSQLSIWPKVQTGWQCRQDGADKIFVH